MKKLQNRKLIGCLVAAKFKSFLSIRETFSSWVFLLKNTVKHSWIKRRLSSGDSFLKK